MAKVYPLRDSEGKVAGWSKWPNHEGHDPIDDQGPEALDFLARRQQRSAQKRDKQAALIREEARKLLIEEGLIPPTAGRG